MRKLEVLTFSKLRAETKTMSLAYKVFIEGFRDGLSGWSLCSRAVFICENHALLQIFGPLSLFHPPIPGYYSFSCLCCSNIICILLLKL